MVGWKPRLGRERGKWRKDHGEYRSVKGRREIGQEPEILGRCKLHVGYKMLRIKKVNK